MSEPAGTLEHRPATEPSGRRAHPLTAWLRRAVPTALVLAALAGLAWWGHHTGWNFRLHPPAADSADTARRSDGLAVVSRGVPDPAGAELPPALRRRLTLTFDSAEAVEKAGIDIAPVWTAAMTETVTASGELSFDPTRVARLSSRAPGLAWRVTKAVGDSAQADEVLALIDAAEVGKVKAEFQQALVQVRLKQKGVANLQGAGQVIPERQRQEAEAALRDAQVRLFSAEQALVNLGLPVRAADYQSLPLDEVVRRMRLLGLPDRLPGLDPHTATANLLPLRAPFAGVVLTADVVAGEMVEAGKPLLTVVDPRRLWLTLHVGSDDARRVAVGQAVKFRPDGLTGEFDGRLTWVGTAADETTRTVPVRAELANDDGRLRASTLGRGRVILREIPSAVVVPNEAVQSFAGTPVVFVRDPDFLKPGGPKTFHARPVRSGARDAQNTEIRSDVRPDEVVATKGSGLLLNELKRVTTGPATGRRDGAPAPSGPKGVN